jgi:hypothetical protein
MKDAQVKLWRCLSFHMTSPSLGDLDDGGAVDVSLLHLVAP